MPMEGNPVTPIGRVNPSKWKGLGDVVATIAQPIATVSDALLKTHFKTCAGCKRRRETLNEKFPL